MPSLVQLTNLALISNVGKNEAHPRSFYEANVKQVEEDGLLLWEVCCSGMTRRFKYDWRQFSLRTSCQALQVKDHGNGLVAGQLGVQFPILDTAGSGGVIGASSV